VAQEQTRARRPAIERVRARQRRHRQRTLFIRVPFALAGFAVLLVGVIMLFTPGPGWALIIFGLGLLALEFTWAERLLERVLHRVEQVSDGVIRDSPVRRAIVLTLGAAVAVGFLAWSLFGDIPIVPG
jgi:uncharacterized protein (TIGR02611 family)